MRNRNRKCNPCVTVALLRDPGGAWVIVRPYRGRRDHWVVRNSNCGLKPGLIVRSEPRMPLCEAARRSEDDPGRTKVRPRDLWVGYCGHWMGFPQYCLARWFSRVHDSKVRTLLPRAA